MLDLTTPTAHVVAYEWASVLLAHFALGAAAWGALAAILRRWYSLHYLASMQVSVLTYFFAWEGLVQWYGAGLMDALVDTVAWSLGGVFAWGAWTKRGGLSGAAGAVLTAVLALGVRRRS